MSSITVNFVCKGSVIYQRPLSELTHRSEYFRSLAACENNLDDNTTTVDCDLWLPRSPEIPLSEKLFDLVLVSMRWCSTDLVEFSFFELSAMIAAIGYFKGGLQEDNVDDISRQEHGFTICVITQWLQHFTPSQQVPMNVVSTIWHWIFPQVYQSMISLESICGPSVKWAMEWCPCTHKPCWFRFMLRLFDRNRISWEQAQQWSQELSGEEKLHLLSHVDDILSIQLKKETLLSCWPFSGTKLVTSVGLFRDRLHQKYGFLSSDRLIWKTDSVGMVIAGGAVIEALCCDPTPANDLDIFLYGDENFSHADFHCVVSGILQSIIQFYGRIEYTVEGFLIHIRAVSDNDTRLIQIIAGTLCHSACEVVQAFDLDYVQVLYDGEDVKATAECLLALSRRTVFRWKKSSAQTRLDKALTKGFSRGKCCYQAQSDVSFVDDYHRQLARSGRPAAPQAPDKAKQWSLMDETTCMEHIHGAYSTRSYSGSVYRIDAQVPVVIACEPRMTLHVTFPLYETHKSLFLAKIEGEPVQSLEKCYCRPPDQQLFRVAFDESTLFHCSRHGVTVQRHVAKLMMTPISELGICKLAGYVRSVVSVGGTQPIYGFFAEKITW